jgi:hypothetical protein
VSIKKVEKIHLRLKEEITRLGFSLAKASREMGESSPQRLKDVTNGRQKLPTELLASAALIGVDIIYVVTGEQGSKMVNLTTQETALVENYRASSEEDKNHIEAVGASFAQQDIGTSINQ